MQNTAHNKLQLVLIAVKDWGKCLKLGRIAPPKPLEKTLDKEKDRGDYTTQPINL